MKCYNCGKNFEYETYYGICPKCGCYNKPEEKDLHQELHDLYDGGYTHSEATHGYGQSYMENSPGQAAQAVHKRGKTDSSGNGIQRTACFRRMQGSTKFLLGSIAFFLLVFVGGTCLGMAYEEHVANKLQKELIASEVESQYHVAGETFAFQGMFLSVTDVKTLATDEEIKLPAGKKLVAVQLKGTSNGEWEDYNQISDAYIRCQDSCYWQIPDYEYEAYGNVYGYPALDSYALTWETEAEGWIAFLLNKEETEFTLCLEERTGEHLVQIQLLHLIPLKLEEEK